MHQAEMFIVWMNQNKTVTLSRRASKSHSPPSFSGIGQDFSILNTTSIKDDGSFSVIFRRSLQATPCSGTEVNIPADNTSTTSVIWAYSLPFSKPNLVANPNTPLTTHNWQGGGNCALLDPASSFDHTFSYDTNSTIVDNGGESTTDHISNAIAHGLLMFLAWQVFSERIDFHLFLP